MEQIELAKRSRVAVGTIRRMESFDEEVGARTSTLSQVQKALDRSGVEFLNDGQPGVRLKRTSGKILRLDGQLCGGSFRRSTYVACTLPG